jgi:hypothetical protein
MEKVSSLIAVKEESQDSFADAHIEIEGAIDELELLDASCDQTSQFFE